eukprot:6349044-Pyramimonas_sp.AAC.1
MILTAQRGSGLRRPHKSMPPVDKMSNRCGTCRSLAHCPSPSSLPDSCSLPRNQQLRSTLGSRALHPPD